MTIILYEKNVGKITYKNVFGITNDEGVITISFTDRDTKLTIPSIYRIDVIV